MKKSNTKATPKTEHTHRLAIVGVVGAAIALALSVAPLLGIGASADGGFGPTACIRAESDGGQFVGQSGGCRDLSDSPSIPVEDCDDLDDAVAGQLASAQAQVASLDGGRAAFESEVGSVIESIVKGAGNLQPGTTALRTFNFTLDSDQAIGAICKGEDPLSLVQYDISTTTPIKTFGINLGSLEGRWQGVVGGVAPTLTASAPNGTLDPGVMLGPVSRLVEARTAELLRS